jgi:glycerophosphoryl diester phosphodiesterase
MTTPSAPDAARRARLSLRHDALPAYRLVLRSQVGFALAFRILAGLLVAPLAGGLLALLAGHDVVDSTVIVAWVLSPRGALTIVLAGTTYFTLYLLEQSGLAAIAAGALQGIRVSASDAMRLIVFELPQLLRLAARFVFTAILLLAPVGIVAAVFASRLLPRHDINYYLARRPPEFLVAIGTIGAIALVALAVAAWLAVRWRLAVPVSVVERPAPAAVLRESARLVRGNWWRVALTWLLLFAITIVLSFVGTWLARAMGAPFLSVIGRGARSTGAAIAVLFLLHATLLAVVSLAGALLDSWLVTWLYDDLSRLGGAPPPRDTLERAAAHDDFGVAPSARVAGIGVVAALAVAALLGTFLAGDGLRGRRVVEVSAHRGETTPVPRPPENTLAAVRRSIATGAQYAEIDVQESKDGVLFVVHDADLSRFGGPATKIWDMAAAEIRAVDIGIASGEPFAGERVPTLDEMLALTQGRIRLNIELKYYGHDQRLAERVVAAVRARRMEGEVIVQSLVYRGLQEVRALAPEIPVGYVLSVNARRPERLDVDFYSVERGRADARFLRAAHREGRQVHVWTVDDPADMRRLAALGADNLITNRPESALVVRREWATMAVRERALTTVRTWLAQ